MSATPAVRYVFAVAFALLSAAPVSARKAADSTPLLWAPAPPDGLVFPQNCLTEYTGDNVTDFASADAQAVRDAVAAAATGATIRVAGYCAGVSAGHLVDISGKALTLRGGYTDTKWTTAFPITQPTTLDGVNAGRVIRTNRALTVENLSILNGLASASPGGGIWNSSSSAGVTIYTATFRNNNGGFNSSGWGGGVAANGPVTIANSTFANNVGGPNNGGAVYAGRATIINSTFYSNSSAGNGGAVYAINTVSALNSTFSHNQADPGAGAGGGLRAAGAVYLTNTVIANNGPDDCAAGGATAVTTLIEDGSCNATFSGDPGLQPLADNGGATWTMALLLGSSAINKGSNALAPAADQRGVARPQNGTVDLGAFEAILYVLTPIAGTGGVITPSTPQTVNIGGSMVFTVTPASGYSILDVGVDGVAQGALSVYTFTSVMADRTITATFAINTYALTPTAGANGSITPGTPQTVNYSGTTAFTITPDTGYHVVDVGVDGVSQGALQVYTFTNVTADHTITAAFGINTYTLTMTTTAFIVNASAPTVTIPGAGSAGITPTAGANPFSYGSVITLGAAAQAGWAFAGWSGDADCADGVVMIVADLICAARFETWQAYIPSVLR